MTNAIYRICEKLKGYTSEPEYFEVISAYGNNDGTYTVVVKPAERREEAEAERAKIAAYLNEKHLQEAQNESDK